MTGAFHTSPVLPHKALVARLGHLRLHQNITAEAMSLRVGTATSLTH